MLTKFATAAPPMFMMPASVAPGSACRRPCRHLHRRQHVHRDAGRADRVALRLEAARRVDRQPAVLFGPALEDRAGALAPRRQAHRFVLDHFGDREAVMRLDQVEVVEVEPRRGERPLPGELRPLEGEDVALLHRQEIVDLLGGAERDRLFQRRARSAHRRARRAAAPSETSEQSVRFSGPATSGFLSETLRQNS